MAHVDIVNALKALDSDVTALDPAPLQISDHIYAEIARPAHIRGAFVARDAARVLRHDDASMAIVTKQVSAGRPFVWVLPLVRVPDQWIVADAIRLYGDDDQVAAWTQSPLEAFAEVLDNFGLDFIAGTATKPVRFAPFVRVPAPGGRVDLGALTSALSIEPGSKFHVSQMIRVTDDGEAQMAFAYFVDDEAYAAALKSASRGR